jgi:hypothetical protein
MPLFDLTLPIISLSQLCMTTAFEIRALSKPKKSIVETTPKALFTELREIAEALGYLQFAAANHTQMYDEFYVSQGHVERLFDQTLAGCNVVLLALRHEIDTVRLGSNPWVEAHMNRLLVQVKEETLSLHQLKQLAQLYVPTPSEKLNLQNSLKELDRSCKKRAAEREKLRRSYSFLREPVLTPVQQQATMNDQAPVQEVSLIVSWLKTSAGSSK